jgi:hypothetical protein
MKHLIVYCTLATIAMAAILSPSIAGFALRATIITPIHWAGVCTYSEALNWVTKGHWG